MRENLDAATTLAESTLSGPATYLDKPVTAAKFVKAVAATLKVELSEQGQAEAAPADALRQEVMDLLDGADPGVLRKALEVLKRTRSG